MTICCNTKSCDTALLSLKPGDVGYRCYLFNCSSKCIFVSHNDYSVMSYNDDLLITTSQIITTTTTTIQIVQTGYFL
jgi:hypothetical protein